MGRLLYKNRVFALPGKPIFWMGRLALVSKLSTPGADCRGECATLRRRNVSPETVWEFASMEVVNAL